MASDPFAALEGRLWERGNLVRKAPTHKIAASASPPRNDSVF